MITGTRLALLAALGALLAAVPAASSNPVPSPRPAPAGKELYRVDCGQCHALAQTLVAGFGAEGGRGQIAGPSFDGQRVPYALALVAVTEGFGPPGHRRAIRRMTWQQLNEVAAFLAGATENNPDLAQLAPARSPGSALARG